MQGIGVLGAAADPTSFVIAPGNVNVWGTAVEIWGTDDSAAVLPVGGQAVWDIHKLRLTDANTNQKTYVLRLIIDDTSAADGITAGTYSEYDLYLDNANRPQAPVDILTERQPADICMWAQLMTLDGTSASTLSMVFEAHGYPN